MTNKDTQKALKEFGEACMEASRNERKRNEFDEYAEEAASCYYHVAVCRSKVDDSLFHIPFSSKTQLENFLHHNHGDVFEVGFYAKGFSCGEFVGENT